MSDQSRRLKKIEAARNGSAGCPDCGWDTPVGESIEVVWRDTSDEPPELEYCETCGRQTSFNLSLGGT